MKTIRRLLILFITVIIFISCSKNSDGNGGNTTPPIIPILSTTAVSLITPTSAQSGGTITSDGGSPITARGVCWWVVVPTIANPKTVDGTGIGSFTSSLTSLFPNTGYYVRAYATNSAGTGYGQEIFFWAPQVTSVPTVTTNTLTSSNSHTVTTGGDVTTTGNSPVTAKGTCWSTSPNPTIANNTTTDGSGIGGFSSYITTLTVNTTYYFRAYATNSIGTGYGSEISFTMRYVIGEGLGGGRIFYVDNTNAHGLIVAASDQSGGARWNHTSNPYSNINAYSSSNGVSNTNNIIAAIGTSGHAATISRAYNGGGYTDWYLPSINELYQLYLQRNIIGNFQSYLYWSSTASTSYVASAWAQDFGGGTSYNDRDKTELLFVRAIRAF